LRGVARRSRTCLPVLLLALGAAVAACAGPATSVAVEQPVTRATTAATAGTTAGATAGPTTAATSAPTRPPSPPAPLRQLPRGGRAIFPRHMVVMAYGTANAPVLGVLGEVPPQQAARRLEAGSVQWAKASGRPVLPAFELITTVAQRSPGRDGRYSAGLSHADVQRYLTAARAAKMLLVLDFQPGRANVLDQVKHYEKFLLQPEVGVAIDPEWVLKPGQRPGRQIGSLDATTINAVSSYLANLTIKNRLPEKIFMVHQFKTYMLPDRQRIVDRPGLALVFHVDGFGPRHSKRQTYGLLSSKTGVVPGGRVHNGFKLFFDEDVNLMSAKDVMAIRPRPELVSYQ